MRRGAGIIIARCGTGIVNANPKGEAIQTGSALTLDCFAPLAMTGGSLAMTAGIIIARRGTGIVIANPKGEAIQCAARMDNGEL
ncbi:MAG: hypothetical protein LBT00_05475 [Spirochaetaceae bacterium]|nr:hypothetical protein [Spirochaetaceae bacterium]